MGNPSNKEISSGADLAPPPFSYSQIIKTPNELGSATDSTAISNNMTALRAYTDIFITSDSKANANPGHALGDQYWLKTMSTCKKNNKIVPRYIYINNQPVSNNKIIKTEENYIPDVTL